MNLKALLTPGPKISTVDSILRHQLLWMLLLRVILYTLLLGLNYFFRRSNLDVILIPNEVMIILLLTIYTTTIGSAFHLLGSSGDMRRPGFIQILLDTLFASVLVYYTGISLSGFSSVYFFPIIAGGLLLPRKGGMVSAAAATLQYGTLLTMELLGIAYPGHILDMGYIGVREPLVALNHFSVHGLTFFLAAILSGLFSLRVKTTETALTDTLRDYDRLAILYKQIFDNIPTGIITVDDTGIITSANRATAKITGFIEDSLRGKSILTVFPDFNLNAPRMRQASSFIRMDGKKIRLGYSHVDLEQPNEKGIDSLHQHKIITLRDISEIEQMERQMRQAEKLAAIGMMSASIAHDFRNPLTAISGSAQMLASEFGQEDKENIVYYELAHIILRESNRMISTIADFLKFSRPEDLDRQWFSLKGCIDEVMEVCTVGPTWPISARLIIRISEVTDIWADPKQMFIVFNHLIQNGLVFCPAGEEEIIIEAQEVKGKGETDRITISVSDNGPGVDKDIQEKIFEPFFTSRADGTGLGLAIVRQIVEEHDGTISVGRAQSGGACFLISLPLPS